MGRVEGKIAIVTGGANGIGKATATRFVEEGAKVVIGDTDAAALAETAKALTAKGGEVVALEGDVSDEAQANALIQAAIDRFGRIDILVNNVGRSRYGKIWEMSLEDWDFAMRVNLRTTFLCTRAAIPHMMKQKSGRIVCISSGAKDGSPWNSVYRGCAGYSTAKAGIRGFIRDLALELAEHGIHVNEVSPGPIATERATPHLQNLNATVDKSPERMTPMRRLGQPIEIANAVLFLASPEASYITGHTMPVAGGL